MHAKLHSRHCAQTLTTNIATVTKKLLNFIAKIFDEPFFR
jgi:hypothetical protein